MNQPDPQTQIDNYLMNRLSPEQRQQFERQMASDSELADAVALQKLSLDLLEAQNDTVLRDAVRRAQAQGGSGGNANNGGPRNYGPWLIGFLLLALLGTLGYYFSQSQSPVQTTPPDAEQLFAEYFKAYPLNFASREINGGDQAQVRANQFYRAQQYAEAIPQFQKSLATDDKPKVRLALALSLLANGQGDLAIDQFQKIIATKDFLYLEPASWYRSLAYLQQGDFRSTRLSLQSIRSNSQFYQQAQALRAALPVPEK